MLAAGHDIEEFVKSRSLEDYGLDKLLKAAVERKLFVVGEAWAQLRQNYPNLADQLSHTHEIIGFRHRLAHGYFE